MIKILKETIGYITKDRFKEMLEVLIEELTKFIEHKKTKVPYYQIKYDISSVLNAGVKNNYISNKTRLQINNIKVSSIQLLNMTDEEEAEIYLQKVKLALDKLPMENI